MLYIIGTNIYKLGYHSIGLGKAMGEYIVFLDVDDILRPFCLKQRIKIMNEQQVCFVFKSIF
jgi:cellulose synthase/poly-beta-1,6-N-acetylglucosamine synthase-like glycosyltransferase